MLDKDFKVFLQELSDGVADPKIPNGPLAIKLSIRANELLEKEHQENQKIEEQKRVARQPGKANQ